MRTLLRKTFPKIRVVQVKGQTFYQVDARKQGTVGRRETFAKREDAEKRASDIAADFSANGADGLKLPLDLRVMAEGCAKTLASFGKSLHDATTFYVQHLQRESKKLGSAKIETLATDWYADKASPKRRQLRKQTLYDIRDTANLLKRLFGDKTVLQVQRHDIEKYLDSLQVSARRRYNIRNLINQFFNWCVKNKYTSVNPCEGIEIEVPAKDVAILNVDRCIGLMKLCEDKHRHLILYHALCLFSGLRPTECQLLTWENIHLEERQITVLGITSKTKETRNVPIEENLLHWLESHEGERKGLVTRNQNLVTHLKHFRADMGYRVFGKNPNGEKWVEDILRHSYASYWIAKYKDRAHLAENMGNSLKMIKQHYKRIVANSAVETFWSIAPNFSTRKNVLTDEEGMTLRMERLNRALGA